MLEHTVLGSLADWGYVGTSHRGSFIGRIAHYARVHLSLAH